MLQRLERRPSTLVERDDLPIKHDPPDLLPPRRGGNARVHGGQVLVVPGAKLNVFAVLDQ